MKQFLYLLGLSVFLVSCGSSRPSGYVQTSPDRTIFVKPGSNRTAATRPSSKRFNTSKVNTTDNYIIKETSSTTAEVAPEYLQKASIIDFARSFEGTPYRYGGTTRAGMDCSGLVCTAFEQEQISLPRSSKDMATQGIRVSLREVQPGDLVFFKTTRRNVISHVGIVVETADGIIQFIHSSTQAGVIISSMTEDYWKRTFVEARRVI